MTIQLEREWKMSSATQPQEGEITERTLLVDPGSVNKDLSSSLIRVTVYPEHKVWLLRDEDSSEVSPQVMVDKALLGKLASFYQHLRQFYPGIWKMENPRGVFIRFIGEVPIEQKGAILRTLLRDLEGLARTNRSVVRLCRGGSCEL